MFTDQSKNNAAASGEPAIMVSAIQLCMGCTPWHCCSVHMKKEAWTAAHPHDANKSFYLHHMGVQTSNPLSSHVH